jgi:hypothetical protein
VKAIKMSNKILVSTAYLPPIEYFSIISKPGEILIELEENYHKQTYRNRCYILSSHGSQMLSVPVFSGSLHKTALKEIRIDYSKRWQQVHLRAMTAAYGTSPFFEFYNEEIFRIISAGHKYLIDLNMSLTIHLLEALQLDTKIAFTTYFEPLSENPDDYRYRINPKKQSIVPARHYSQVFNTGGDFVPGLSIVDLLFNMGPESIVYLG